MIQSEYRYRLVRRWSDDPRCQRVCWVMLNPSTADDKSDDPTLRRIISFSKREGFGALVVANLCGLRSSKPSALKLHRDPIGAENDANMRRAMSESHTIIAGWGATVSAMRWSYLVHLFWEAAGDSPVFCLGTTKDGSPRHPLYLKDDEPLIRLERGEWV